METTQNDTSHAENNPRKLRITTPARAEASRRNGAQSPGRARLPMDWEKYRRLESSYPSDEDGNKPRASWDAIARSLGMSYWTLKRWRADRGEEDSPW
jgi:hypothetical protein